MTLQYPPLATTPFTLAGYQLRPLEPGQIRYAPGERVPDYCAVWKGGPYVVIATMRDDDRSYEVTLTHKHRFPTMEELIIVRRDLFPLDAQVRAVVPAQAGSTTIHLEATHE